MPDAPADMFAPFYPARDYMIPAWLSCLYWAVGDADMMDAYRTATGDNWRPSGGLNAMVDAATGADRAFFLRFAGWFNTNVWGPE